MPRLNNSIPAGAQRKFNSMDMHSDIDNFNLVIYVREPLGSSEEGEDVYTETGKFVNFANTTIRDGTSTVINIPTKPAASIGSEDGTIRGRILEGTRAPESTTKKGKNTIDWLQNNRNVTVELDRVLPDDDRMLLFYFEDPTQNQIPIVAGESQLKVSATTYYKTNERPKVDHLNTKNSIVGEKLDLIGSLAIFLQNEDSGASLEINYTTTPIKVKNGRYMELVIDAFPLVNSIEITAGGSPVTIDMIDKLNKPDGIPDSLVSDNWYIDLADSRNSLEGGKTLPYWRSTMSGEIHNKFRIWDTLFVGIGTAGDFEDGSLHQSDEKGEWQTGNAQDGITFYKNFIPNTEYVLLRPPGLSNKFSDEILDVLSDGERQGVKAWYNEFSFFENLFSTKTFPDSPGNPLWKTSNAYIAFDVEHTTIGVDFLIISNPNKHLENPNLDDNDYKQFTRDAITGNVNINGTSFSGWTTTLEPVDKDDKIFNWTDNLNDKKYIVMTPILNEVARYKKLLTEKGQGSRDNDINVKIGFAQTTSARHPFPTGDGSVDIHYQPNIFFSKEYCVENGWPINNKIVLDLGSEREIDKVLLNIYGGIKYRITWYDSKYDLSTGVDEDGNDVVLSPTIISAGNVDITQQPLKAAVEVIYGLPTALMILKGEA